MFGGNTPLLVLTFLLDFNKVSEIVTIQQTDGIVYKLKPKLF